MIIITEIPLTSSSAKSSLDSRRTHVVHYCACVKCRINTYAIGDHPRMCRSNRLSVSQFIGICTTCMPTPNYVPSFSQGSLVRILTISFLPKATLLASMLQADLCNVQYSICGACPHSILLTQPLIWLFFPNNAQYNRRKPDHKQTCDAQSCEARAIYNGLQYLHSVGLVNNAWLLH